MTLALYEELARRISAISGKSYLFFDKIQEVEDWGKCINSVRVDFNCDIYVTGSNAKLFSGELVTYLGGRYVEFVIYPFSFKEYMECKRLAGKARAPRVEKLQPLQSGAYRKAGKRPEPKLSYPSCPKIAPMPSHLPRKEWQRPKGFCLAGKEDF